jgi:hypothetical protein
VWIMALMGGGDGDDWTFCVRVARSVDKADVGGSACDGMVDI